MTMYSDNTDGQEPGKQNDANHWLSELDKYAKRIQSWEKRTRDVIKRYLSKRDTSYDIFSTRKQFNILWSNVQILQPTLYSRTPKAEVIRRFRDKDPVGKLASQLLERSLDYNIEVENLDNVMKRTRDDALLGGRGVARVRIDVELKEEQQQVEVIQDEAGNLIYLDGVPFDGDPGSVAAQPDGRLIATVTVPNVEQEKFCFDYVHWSDFSHSDGRNWDEVYWVGFDTFLTKEQAIARFGKEKVANLDFDATVKSASPSEQERTGNKARITEIWCKETKRVYWVAKGCPCLLDVKDDPLKLRGFFPCPKPLCFTTTNDSLIPSSDFDQYEVYANLLDTYTIRIDKLVRAIRRVGIYDPSSIDLERVMNEGSDTDLIPAKDWPSFVQGGGVDGIMQFVPVRELVQALNETFQAFDQTISKIFELVGISDIVRGNSAPNETATAQQIKGEFFSVRVSERQFEVQRFARDLIAFCGELIAEHASEETIYNMSGAQFLAAEDPTVEQNFQPAIQLLRDDRMRTFRINIETDSTLAQDDNADKQARVEFLQTVGGFLQNIKPLADQDPAFAPLAYQMIQFGVRGFKAGRTLEGSIDNAILASQQQAQAAQEQQAAMANQPPPPTPEEIEMQRASQEAQAKQAIAMQEAQTRQQVAMQTAEIKKYMAEVDAQLKQQKQGLEQQLAQQKAEFEALLKQQKLQSDIEINQMNAALDDERKRKESALKQVTDLKKAEIRSNADIVNEIGL